MTAPIDIARLSREATSWPTSWRPALGEEGEWDGFWWCENNDGEEDRVSAEVEEDYANEFAERVASLVNATPVLTAAVLAALDFRDAFSAYRSAVDALTATDSPQALAAVRSSRADGIEAQRKLFEALKQVSR